MVGRQGTYPGLCELDVIDGADAAGDARTIAARIRELCAQGFAVREGGYNPALQPRGFLYSSAQPCGLCGLPVGTAGGRHSGLRRYGGGPAGCTSRAAPLRRCWKSLITLPRTWQWRRYCSVPMFPFTRMIWVQLRRRVKGGSLYGAVLTSDLPKCSGICPAAGGFPPTGPHPAGGCPDRGTVRPHRVSGSCGSHAGRCPLPGGPAQLCRLGSRAPAVPGFPHWCVPCGLPRDNGGLTPEFRQPGPAGAASPS